MTSWVLALCVTPTLCYFFIHPENKKEKEEKSSSYYQTYEHSLHWMLKHKALFMLAVILVFIFSMNGFKHVSQQFFPDSDRTQIMMYIDLPNGTSARETNRQMKDVFSWLNDKEKFPEITNFSGYSGFNGPRFVLSLNPEDPSDNKGFVIVNVKEGTKLNPMVNKLHNGLIESFPNVSARVKRMFMGPSDSSSIKIQVKGPDKDVIYSKAKEIMAVLHQQPNTINVRTDWENRIVKVIVKVDQHRARRAGITSSDIANALQGYFTGTTVTDFREEDDIIPVVLRAKEDERFNLDRLRTASVFSKTTHQAVPLFQVANIVPLNQYSKIIREDMFRTISVEARNTSITAQDLYLQVKDKIQILGEDLPVNQHYAIVNYNSCQAVYA